MKNQTYIFAVWSLGLSAALAAASSLGQQKQPTAITPQQADFFESKIRPLIANNCASCHGPSMQQGGVRLDLASFAFRSIHGGAIVARGDPAKSALIQVIRYDGKVKMPPAGKLKPTEIEALTDWVKMGAPWPADKASDAAKLASATGDYVITDAQRRFWSFLPVTSPQPPAVKNRAWCASPIDQFILSRLEQKGLLPSPRADKRTLIRRAYFDLIGLPPTAEEIDSFAGDKAPDAYEKLIDHLLADPRYGERWGRYWLDVARYADTKGYVFEEDRIYHNGYTYRDYVIRSLNEDKPYDRFLKEQLAADRMPEIANGDDRRPLAALGFLTLGRRFLNSAHDIADDRIDVTMRGLQGLTVNCARCHDHKFDPISSKDYYALSGVFMNSTEPNPPPAISPRSISEPYEAQNAKLLAAQNQYDKTLMAQISRLRGIMKSKSQPLTPEVLQALQGFREGTKPTEAQLAKIEPQFDAGIPDQQKSLRQQISALRDSMPKKPEFAQALADVPNPTNPHVLIRGNPGNPGPEVSRRFLAVLSPGDPAPFTNGSGRLDLAEAIASKSNPLTARVFVNRVWRWHFGQGLVRTPSDFGIRGERPTHPELLDWLAAKFMEGGWSIKKLHRLIMLSSTYTQSSDMNSRAFAADPENRLVWHMNRRRLDFEATRDSLLYVSGKLNGTMFGPSVDLTTAPYTTRRSLYGFVDRQNLEGLFRTFDFASPDQTSPQRFTTTIPQQALFMMNSPFVVEQARGLLARPEVAKAGDDSERISQLYRAVFGRFPSSEELALGLRFVQQSESRTAKLVSLETPSARAAMTGWERYGQALLMSNEFVFVD